MRSGKIRIILHIGAVCSESPLGSFFIAKDAEFLHVDNEYSDQTVDSQSDLSPPMAHISESALLQLIFFDFL